MASEAVLKYLTDTNRPYSCADITVNLRGAFPKSAIQKALDSLSESGKIKCKLYGKQKVYAALQPDVVVGECDVEDYDAQLKTITQDLTDKGNALKVAEASLKTLVSLPTTEAAKSQTNAIKIKIEAAITKLESLRTSKEVVSAEEKKSILNEHEKLLREYRKRKRMANDMLEAILEGYPKSKQSLIEELCIETDEMVNFKINT